MKTIWFHLQGYRDLPEDFRDRYPSIWVTPPNAELCDPVAAGRYLNENLAELFYADEVGFDGIGTNEHHQNGYCYSGSPNMTAGVLASRPSTGAICLLGTTLPLYHPLRVAEELATIDCMSGGRLVTGWPVGTPMDTVGVMGVPPTEVRPRYYEAHDFIKQAWSRPGPFPFNGKFIKQRYVNPWPTPIQRPHPPIWLAGAGSMETWEFAANNDYTYNSLSLSGYRSAQGMLEGYWQVIERHGLDDNPYRAGFSQLVCVADTDAEAERLYWPHIKGFYERSLHVAPEFATIPGYMSRASMANSLKKTGKTSPFSGVVDRSRLSEGGWAEVVEKQGSVIAGSPDTVAERLEDACRRLRAGHLIAIMQIGSMPTDLTKHSTKLFADKVLPRLQTVWDAEGYVDHWWPSGATRNPGPVATADAAVLR